MGLEPELDAGPVYRKREIPIDEQITASGTDRGTSRFRS